MSRKFTFTTQVYDERTDFPATGDVDVIYIDASKNTAYRYDVDYYTISSAEVDIWGALGSVSKGGGGGGGASWGSINGTLSNQTDLQTALDAKQDDLVSGTNIKTINGSSVLGSGDLVVSGGGGASGIHAAFIRSGVSTTYMINSLTSYNATASTNLRLAAVPFLPNKTFTTSGFYINCGTFQAGALARILIYSALNGLPDQKLYESANLDLSTNGIKTATTSFTFTAGTNYFICTHTQGTATLTNIPPANLYPISIGGISNPATFFTAQVAYPIGSAPTTFGSVNTVSGSVILVGITSA